jgi:hypothetical protein
MQNIRAILFLFFLILIIPIRGLTAASAEIKKIDCYAREFILLKDNISLVDLARYCFDSNHILAFDSYRTYLMGLRKWNPHLGRADQIPAGTELYLNYPDSYVSFHYADPLTLGKFKPKLQRYKFGVFVATSRSEVEESMASSTVQLASTQNSPFTIGVFGSRKLDNRDLIAYSSYLSIINVNTGSANIRRLDFPPELGFTLYYKFKLQNWNFTPYLGTDIERISAYNLDDIVNSGADASNRKHHNFYLTAGFNQLFSIATLRFMLISSFSYSAYSYGTQDGQPVAGYSGNKYILHLSYLTASKFTYSIFYKQHSFSGATEAKFNRIGIAVNYSLL